MTNLSYLNVIRRHVTEYLQQFPDDSQFLGFLPEQLAQEDLQIGSRKNFSGHLTASALLVDPSCTETFLIHHNFLGRWLQPGGHVDLLEQLSNAAARELIEETGICNFQLHDWHTKHKIAIDIDSHFIPRNSAKQEFSHFHHDFLFVFVLSPASASKSDLSQVKFQLQAEEVAAGKWISLEALNEAEFGKRLLRAAKKTFAISAIFR